MWRKSIPLAVAVALCLFGGAVATWAQVATLNAWALGGSNVPTGTTFSVTVNNVVVSAGNSRLLVVACVLESGSPGTVSNFNATLGGTAMTAIGTTETSSQRMTIKTWYLVRGTSATNDTAANLVVSGTHQQTPSGVQVFWGSYSGVSQTAPIINTQNTAFNGAASITFGATINYPANGLTLYAAGNGASPATETPPTGFTERTISTASGETGCIADTGTQNPAGSFAATTAVAFSGTTARSVLSVASLNPAASANTTTLGNGVAGTNAAVCPGASSQKLDGFSFVNSAGTNPVTALTVTTTGQTAIASMEIWNEAGTTQYFTTVANPGSNTWSFSGGTSIPVGVAPAQNFKVLATYDPQAGAPAGSTATTAYVSSFTTGNGKAGTDTADTTLTLDNASPNAPTGPTCAGVSSSQIDLGWANPGTDFSGALVVRGPAGGGAPTFVPAEGATYAVGAQGGDSIIAAGNVAAASDTGLASGTAYAYRIYAYDACLNYSTALATSCSTPSAPGTTTQAPGATVNSCVQITVSCPFQGDSDADGSVQVQFGTSASGPWTTSCAAATGASPRTCAVPGLTQATAYYFRVTFADPDGVSGTNPQVIGPFTTQDCRVAPGVPTATVNACNQIAASAPYTGDADADSTTTFSRGASATGPWTAVCSGVTGASPRACTDNGVVASTTYYYQVTFTDADGVNGTNPQVIGPFSTPTCSVLKTTAGTASMAASGCRQVTVTAPFSGDDDGDGTVTVEYNIAASWPGTTACVVSGASPRMCSITNLNPSTAYYVRVTYADPDGVSGTAVQVLGPLTTPACGSDQIPPVLTMLSPSRNAVISGADTFKVQVYDAGGLAASNPVKWAVDSAVATNTTVTVNASYSCGTRCTVYEIAVPAQSAQPHYLTVTATDAAGNEGRISWPFVAKAAKTGSGDLLRRTHSSELCLDCHALQTHNAQFTTAKYGNWAVDCQTCHTAHATKNIYLVRERLQTPNSGVKSPVFYKDDRAGGTNPANSYLGPSTSTYDDGICEACHTKTNHYRNSTSGGDHTHNQGSRCVGCHEHAKGFGASESDGCAGTAVTGDDQCSKCHPNMWGNMNTGSTKAYRHTIGAVAGTNDACADSGVTWVNTYTAGTASFALGSATVSGSGTNWVAGTHVGWTMKNNATGVAYRVTGVASFTSLTLDRAYMEPTAATVAYTLSSPLSTNAATTRSCVNMCHTDHMHNDPATATVTHQYNAYEDATTSTTRAVTRDATGAITAFPAGSQGVANTDFDNTAANGGMCLSCHRTGVDATHPAVEKASYNLSAHNLTSTTPGGAWTYTQHDGGTFAKNCTKCHSDGSDTRPGDGSTPFGAVHYSDYPSLLNGTTNPAGTATTFQCYNCHGGGSTGNDYSGKAVYQDGVKGTKHPMDGDAAHNSVTELTSAAFGNSLGIATRHSNCQDCHDPHEAQRSVKQGTASAATTTTLTDSTMSGRWTASEWVGSILYVPSLAAGQNTRSITASTAGGQVTVAAWTTAPAAGAAYFIFDNKADGALQGTWGAQLSSNPAIWTAPGSGNFTKKTVVAGTDLQASLCFKCHSGYYWGAGTPPNGLSANGSVATPVETDVAMEFNPNNGSGHPVLTGLDNYPNSTAVGSPSKRGLQAAALKAPWNVNIGTQTMSCGDCHNTDAASPAAQGPHGSAVQFMLRSAFPGSASAGPTAWPNLNTSNFASSFCANCHNDSTGSDIHSRSDHRGSSVYCYTCHIVVPHGGKLARLIGDGDSANMPARYAYNNNKATLMVTGFTKAATTGYSDSNCGGQGSCTHHSSTNGQQW